MSHVAGVAAILSRHGFAEEVVAAGALHDVMEDCGVTLRRARDEVRRAVADLVRHVSEEDKSLSWEERKRLYLEHFANKPWEAQAITLADKIDNFQSIIVCARVFGDPVGDVQARSRRRRSGASAICSSARGALPAASARSTSTSTHARRGRSDLATRS